MNCCKYLARYRADDLSTKRNNITHITTQKTYTPPAAFQLTSHGFYSADEIAQRVETENFLSVNYRFAERSLPSQLVKAHAIERIEALRAMGQNVGKSICRQIEADTRQELSLSTPPTVSDVRVIFVYAIDEIWILCSGKGQSDKLSKRLLSDIDDLKLSTATAKKSWCQDSFNALYRSSQDCLEIFEHNEALSIQTRIKNIENGINPSFITASWEDLINFGLSNSGEITKITTTDNFEEQWYEHGDPSNPEELEAIALNLWVDSLWRLLRYLFETQEAQSEPSLMAETA